MFVLLFLINLEQLDRDYILLQLLFVFVEAKVVMKDVK